MLVGEYELAHAPNLLLDFDRQVAEVPMGDFAGSGEPVAFTRSVPNRFTAPATPQIRRAVAAGGRLKRMTDDPYSW